MMLLTTSSTVCSRHSQQPQLVQAATHHSLTKPRAGSTAGAATQLHSSSSTSTRGNSGVRRSVACSFTKFPLFFGPSTNQPQPQPPLYSVDGVGDDEGDSGYWRLLQQAEDITFNCPTTQLFGRAGRRCILEDAERMLELCIQERPAYLQPRVLLLRNLMRQSLGRERDVPVLAMQALQDADLPSANETMMRHLHVLQIVMLALKALHKLQEERDATPMPAGLPTYTVQSFLAAAQAAAPTFAADFNNLALRVHRQLLCCSKEQRQMMLYDRDGYMSSADLSAVLGQHHVAAGSDGVSDNYVL